MLNQKENITVVDLGCGTGRSTLAWKEIAKEVVGVEPNKDMFDFATTLCSEFKNIRIIQSKSTETTLKDESVDIVTCSQSLHWMDPQGTFKEANRILVPGGIFAAYDCDWPPNVKDWRCEKGWLDFIIRVEEMSRKNNIGHGVKKWDKSSHIERMIQSNCFSFVKELALHNIETGNAARFMGLVRSQGSIGTLVRAGLKLEDCGYSTFNEVVEKGLGSQPSEWLFSYRVRLGIK